MDVLTKDILFHIVTKLDFDDLISFCLIDKRVNRLIYQQNHIWVYNLQKEFPDWNLHYGNKNVRKVYSLLVKLNILKKKTKYKESIYQLYQQTELNLSLYDNQIKTLPPEIGLLTNLRGLYLSNNEIKTLPPEIGKLSNLRELSLSNNKIETLPPEIGSLRNLLVLYLNNNKIETLPPEIGLLSNLQLLMLHKNQIETLPPEIGSLSNLRYLFLDRTVKKIPDNLKKIASYNM